MNTQPGIHLRSISTIRKPSHPDRFPFNVPVIRTFDSLEFATQVTFFIGENGSGKSTFLEGIAAAAGSIAMGSESVARDRSLDPVRPFGDVLKLTWSKKTRRGFFMRAEDFFGYARKMNTVRKDLENDLQAVDREYEGRSETARGYARMSYLNELYSIKRDYGDGLDAQSHGESYIRFFQARFVPEGLYLLDEPEAPLSPLRQLSFLVMMKEMIAQKAQFLIATHSPILMAFPGATILNFEDGKIRPVRYDEVEHVQITKSFLENPEGYLSKLFEE